MLYVFSRSFENWLADTIIRSQQIFPRSLNSLINGTAGKIYLSTRPVRLFLGDFWECLPIHHNFQASLDDSSSPYDQTFSVGRGFTERFYIVYDVST